MYIGGFELLGRGVENREKGLMNRFSEVLTG